MIRRLVFRHTANMKVVVEQYKPLWAELFQKIRGELADLLKDVPYISIEHVGSTSVVGLAAKPVIDVDIVLQRHQLPAVIEALKRGAFQHYGTLGIPDREVFRRPESRTPLNMYACIEGSQSLRNHLAVRDICRRDKDVREAYAAKKLALAEQEWDSVDEYCEAKNDILAWILKRAGFSRADMDQIREHNTVQNHR